MRSSSHTRPRGMTLIEILFAFAIIGSVLTVAYASALRAWRTAASANQRTQAQYVAQDQLERLRGFRDMTDSATLQKRMGWKADLLDKLYPSSLPTTIHIEACAEDDMDCVWKIEDGPKSLTVPGDGSTSYTYSVTPQKLYCVGESTTPPAVPPAAPNDCGALGVAAVDLQAKVSWNDANGNPDSQLIATTQLLAPTE